MGTMTQSIINKGGIMIKIPSLHSIERVVRMVPIVKDLLPSNKAGLNSLINEPEYKITKLKNTLHDKNADIFKLRQKIKRMKRLLFSNNEKIEKLEKIVESCKYQINLLTKALLKGE